MPLSQIVRLRSMNGWPSGAQAMHAAGEKRAQTAFARPGIPAVVNLIAEQAALAGRMRAAEKKGDQEAVELIGQEMAEARQAAQAEARDKILEVLKARGPKRGRQPKKGLEIIIAGPPPQSGPAAWDLGKVTDWANDAYGWVRESLPDAPVTAAALHMDERSPHIHVILAPIIREGGQLVLGIEGAKRALAGRVGKFSLKGRALMSAVLDAYNVRVGKAWGFERGLKGSPRRNQGITAIKAVEGRKRDAEEALEKAKEELKAVENRLDFYKQAMKAYRIRTGTKINLGEHWTQADQDAEAALDYKRELGRKLARKNESHFEHAKDLREFEAWRARRKAAAEAKAMAEEKARYERRQLKDKEEAAARKAKYERLKKRASMKDGLTKEERAYVRGYERSETLKRNLGKSKAGAEADGRAGPGTGAGGGAGS